MIFPMRAKIQTDAISVFQRADNLMTADMQKERRVSRANIHNFLIGNRYLERA